jgi:hypothetical protein
MRNAWLDLARSQPASPWHGQHLDFKRYSGSQSREVELRGVCGSLTLPQGAGPLAPLLAATEWTHIGKSTVFGLGALRVLPER